MAESDREALVAWFHESFEGTGGCTHASGLAQCERWATALLASTVVERIVAAHKADAWDEGHATAKDYDLSDPLDRQEWEQAYVHEIAVNPYRAEVSS